MLFIKQFSHKCHLAFVDQSLMLDHPAVVGMQVMRLTHVVWTVPERL